jgi:hypothetical protein
VGKSNTLSAATLGLALNGTGITGIADNTATAPLTNTYVTIHTADPTASGNQASNEATNPGMARVAVARNPGSPAWTIAGESASPNSIIIFPLLTGGSGVATFFSIGYASTGASEIIYSGPISPTITLGSGVTPELSTGTTITES